MLEINCEALRVERARRKITMEELATKAGVAITTICHIENGKMPNPRLATLNAIAKALGVPVSTLLIERKEVAPW